MPLNIAAIQYSLESFALEIYVSGCKAPHCPGCHNEELWDFNHGVPMTLWLSKLDEYVRRFGDIDGLIKNVWILGGEPLDQDRDELERLLTYVRGGFPHAKLWLFTRKGLHNVRPIVKSLCHYIKCGAYVEGLPSKDVIINGQTLTLASDNQTVWTMSTEGESI
jgi:organic radical activating enzyme